MIIVVKINRSDKPRCTINICAQRLCNCKAQLNGTKKRNMFKYIAATYKRECDGTFCIQGGEHESIISFKSIQNDSGFLNVSLKDVKSINELQKLTGYMIIQN